MHRLFFALVPDERARVRLAEFAASLRQRHGGAGWVDPTRFHLTLAFLGEWPEYPDAVATRAKDVATGLSSAPFPVRLEKLGTIAGSRPPWVLAAAHSAALRMLVAELRDRLARAGIAYDPRPFVPHLTLRRVRDAAPDLEVRPVEWIANRFELMHSTGSAEPYRNLARFALAAA